MTNQLGKSSVAIVLRADDTLLSEGRIDAAVDTLGASVTKLQESIDRFDAALVGFAENTRDFQEFKLHLKDNIQRMSLGFADLSDTLKTYIRSNPSEPTR